MKKLLLLLCLVNFINFKGFAQALILQITGDDCSKCKLLFDQYLNSIDIPKFLVFPTSYLPDSSFLSTVYSEYKNLNITFNDEILKKFQIRSSGLGYLNTKGEIINQKVINYITDDDIKAIETIYAADTFMNTTPSRYTMSSGPWKVKFNLNTSKIIEVDSLGFKHIKIMLDDSLKFSAIELLKKYKPDFYHLTEQGLNEGKLFKGLVNMSSTPPKIKDNLLYYTIVLPYVIPASEQDKLNGFPDGAIIQQYLIVIHDLVTQNRKIYPVDMNLRVNNENYGHNLSAHMHLLNDTTFLLKLQPSDTVAIKRDRRFLAIYNLHNGYLKFLKKLNNKSPEFIIEKQVYYSIDSDITSIDEPYALVGFSDEILHLENGKSYKMHFNNVRIEYDSIHNKMVENILSGTSTIPISNILLFSEKGHLYVISKINPFHILHKYIIEANGDLKFVRSYNLDEFGLNLASYSSFIYDKQNKMLIYLNKDGKFRKLPISLVG